MNCPKKVRQSFKVKIIQAAERACCLWTAGGKPFDFAFLSSPKKFSITALSKQLPFRLMLCRMPFSQSIRWYCYVGTASIDLSAGLDLCCPGFWQAPCPASWSPCLVQVDPKSYSWPDYCSSISHWASFRPPVSWILVCIVCSVLLLTLKSPHLLDSISHCLTNGVLFKIASFLFYLYGSSGLR